MLKDRLKGAQGLRFREVGLTLHTRERVKARDEEGPRLPERRWKTGHQSVKEARQTATDDCTNMWIIHSKQVP